MIKGFLRPTHHRIVNNYYQLSGKQDNDPKADQDKAVSEKEEGLKNGQTDKPAMITNQSPKKKGPRP